MGLMEANAVLRQMLESGSTVDAAGIRHALHSHIKPRFAEVLYQTVRARRPGLVVEIGLAHGCSTLAILTALDEIGGGRLISVDPDQYRVSGGAWRPSGGPASVRATR